MGCGGPVGAKVGSGSETAAGVVSVGVWVELAPSPSAVLKADSAAGVSMGVAEVEGARAAGTVVGSAAQAASRDVTTSAIITE